METKKTYKVPEFLTNPDSFLSLSHLLGYMADTGYTQVDLVEKEEWKKKYAWVVYSWDVEIIEPLKANDEITISTHAIRMNKFYAYRNFSIKRDGKIVAKAYSVFLLIDVERKRPIKVPKEVEEAYGRQDSIYEGRKVKFEKDFDFEKKLAIRKVDLDQNMHVNNAIYLDLVRDLIDIKDQDVEYFKIIYKNEIKYSDLVIGESVKNDQARDFRLRSEDGKVYTYGKIVKRDV